MTIHFSRSRSPDLVALILGSSKRGDPVDARENAATVSNYYFMNGNTLKGFQILIKDVKERAEREGHLNEAKFA